MHAAKVLLVSLKPPPFPPTPSSPLLLHRNNLVIDDVKAEKVQQLVKSEKKHKGLQFLYMHFIYHWCFSHSVKGLNAETTTTCTMVGVHTHQ